MGLAGLPVNSSDFASACMTARVPRANLKLVIVRMISMSQDDGTVIDPQACVSAGCLVDSRHTLAGLWAAIQSTVECVTLAFPGQIRVFTRTPEDGMLMMPASQDGRTIDEEMTVTDGMLQSAVRVSGALRAWQTQCSIRSTVCIRNVLECTGTTETERVLVSGIQKLTGGGKPTMTIPEACACTGLATCDCFLKRAMYRAGTVWLVVYAVLPPNRRKWERRQAPPPMMPDWVGRLHDGTSSESVCESTVQPNKWPVEMPLFMPFCWDECASEDTLSASESGSTGAKDILPPTGLLEIGVTWALRQPKSRILQILADACKQLGPYYGPPLRSVLGKAGSASWNANLLRYARVLDSGVSQESMYARFRRGASAAETTVSAIRFLTYAEKTNISTFEACQRSGFAGAAVTLTIACIEAHVFPGLGQEIEQFQANKWSAYTVFDRPDVLSSKRE